MAIFFTKEDIDKISKMLDAKSEEFDRGWSWNLKNPANKQSLVFTVYKDAQVSESAKGSLVSVQTQHGYFELHDCDAFMLFEPDEVIFTQSGNNRVNCLVIGKECNCSMFSNINRAILNADLTDIDSPVLLSAMQLSLTESII